MKAIIVSAPTLDRVTLANGETRLQAGGPALYAGYTLRKLKYDVYAVGPYGPMVSSVVRLERQLGIERACCESMGQGYVFVHRYDGSVRRSSIESTALPLKAEDLAALIDGQDPDLVIISPVHCEVPPDALTSKSITGRRVSVDLQGFSRCMPGAWWERLDLSNIPLVHLSNDDASESVAQFLSRRAPSVVYTLGPGGAIIFARGKVTAIPLIYGGDIKDRTGLGDISLALVSHFYLVEGLSLEDAYIESQKMIATIAQELSSLKVLGVMGGSP